jgi:uncharacterized protein YpuA (DUF1002 family)
MKNFTDEEKNQLMELIGDYRRLNLLYSKFKKNLEVIQSSIGDVENELNKVKEREKNFMDSLNEKYGKVSLQELYNSLQ